MVDDYKPTFSVFTVTLGGRDKYLIKLLQYLFKAKYEYFVDFEYILCLNGIDESKVDKNIIILADKLKSKIIKLSKSNIETCMNIIYPLLNGKLIFKLDDDALPIGNNFFHHARIISLLKPNLVFSPFPVGLINNLGGTAAVSREVIYEENYDTYYTLRYVNHIGGFARISPGITNNWKFDESKPHTEDSQHSIKCKELGLQMAYLENALIVEHQESTLGQHVRYKEYFNGRF